MSRENFRDFNFRPATLAVIQQANAIIEDYQSQGFTLTLRQLYYQFVSKDLIENSKRSYDNLGANINDGRLAGLIDWDALEDRTRNMVKNPHWGTPRQFLDSVIPQYYVDHWNNQEWRIEVWVEKDALSGVAEKACRPLDVPFFCCRGYTSQSEMYAAGKRLVGYNEEGKNVAIIHLGDHDPSGVDMSRDIQDRLAMFTYGDFEIDFTRIALNMDQIKLYSPPPNPAKLTDCRAKKYIKQFGSKSWELDALSPKTLVSLIQRKIDSYRDTDKWDELTSQYADDRNKLIKTASKL